ncbi:MAG: hypothetical protein [Bacteriophage sp.]|nr:MAG: hypothetical protein [Bacteriophage sp.]
MSNPAIMIYVPFALNGNKNIIQVTRQENQDQEDATWSEGYPNITMIKQSAGGKAPKGLDMNGVLYAMSSDIVHRQSGKQMLFDAEYATNIGGYAKGSLLQSTDLSRFWISTVDGNTTDPDSATASGWNRFAYTPVATSTTTGTVKLVNSLDSTATDSALTAAQGNVLYTKQLATFAERDLSKGYIWYTDATGYKVMLEQWGKTPEIDFADGYELRVNFPQPFRNNCFNVYLTPYGSNPKAFLAVKGKPDKTGFTVIFYEVSALNQSVGVSYYAIGD